MTPSLPATRAGWRHRVGVITRRFPIIQIVVLLLVFAWGSVRIDGFASTSSLRAMSVLAALLALAALGQTFVILIGGLDLAVPGYITVGAVSASQLAGDKHWPLWLVAVFVSLSADSPGRSLGRSVICCGCNHSS